MQGLIEIGYFFAATAFILALKRMSHPRTAQSGIELAGLAMLIATVMTLFYPINSGWTNYILMLIAMALGGGWAYVSAKKVQMTDMPQMIAIYNGVGGGSAACIAAIALLQGHVAAPFALLATIGGMIGAISFTGSIVAWAKLDGRLQKNVRLKDRNFINIAVFGTTLSLAFIIINGSTNTFVLVAFFLFALATGLLLALPIGGADMPVVISLFNALTGLAVAFEGFALNNSALIIAGMVVGAAGSLLTILMAQAMNRPLSNVLFSNFGETSAEGQAIAGSMKASSAMDAAVQMAYAQKVIIIPGYGLAVAQAQHKVWEMSQLLINQGIEVLFAIHPVAGRMPGHMNVLLAEAGVPYELIFDLDESNAELANADVAIVIGANDVVNPVARDDKTSPLYGMPILNADHAKQVFVIKRGQGTGFSGVENHLFYLDNTAMLYGDAQKMLAEISNQIKAL